MSTGGSSNDVNINIKGNTSDVEKHLAKTDSLVKSWATKIAASAAPLNKSGTVGGMLGNAAEAVGGMSVKWAAYAGAISLAATKMFSLGVASAKAAEDETRSMLKLRAAIKGVGDEVGLSTGQLEGMVDTVSEMGSFDNEEIRAGITSLVQLRFAGQELESTLLSAANLATYTGSSLSHSAQSLGRVLNRPSMARRQLSGILNENDFVKIDELEKDKDRKGAQTLILNRVDAIANDLKRQYERTFTGQTGKMADTSKDSLVAIGQALLPAITALATIVEQLGFIVKGLANVAAIAIAPVASFFEGLSGASIEDIKEKKKFAEMSTEEWENYQTNKRETQAGQTKSDLEKAASYGDNELTDRGYWVGCALSHTFNNFFGMGPGWNKEVASADEDVAFRMTERLDRQSKERRDLKKSGRDKSEHGRGMVLPDAETLEKMRKVDPLLNYGLNAMGIASTASKLDKNFGKYEGVEDTWKRINEESA